MEKEKHRFEELVEYYQGYIAETQSKINQLDQFQDGGHIDSLKRRIDAVEWKIRCINKLMDRVFDWKVYPMLVEYKPMKTATRGLERMCEGFFNIPKEELTFREFFQYTKEQIVQAPPKFGASSYETVIRMLMYHGYDYPEIP